MDEGTAAFIGILNGNMRDGAMEPTPDDLSKLIGRPAETAHRDHAFLGLMTSQWPRCDGLKWPHPSVGIICLFPMVEGMDEGTRGGFRRDARVRDIP